MCLASTYVILVSFSVALKYKTMLSTFYWEYELLLGKVCETGKELVYNYASSATKQENKLCSLIH